MRGLRSGGLARDESGVVTIEFGILLPLLLLLFFGALEVARVQVTATMIERAAFNMSLEARFSNGDVDLQTLVQNTAARMLEPMASADDLTVMATSAESLPLLLSSPSSGLGGEGDVVRLEVRASLGLLSWLVEGGFQTERAFVIYYVNEANSYTSAND